MRKSILFCLICVAVLFASCTKDRVSAEAHPTIANTAEQFIQAHPDAWNGMVTEEEFCYIMAEQKLFDEGVLRSVLNPGEQLDLSPDAVKKRYSILMSNLPQRDDPGTSVETIIVTSPTRKVIDATPEGVALTISNIGQTVQPNTSYDYLSNSLMRITASDVYLANWAYNNSDAPGSFIAGDDDFIEVESLTYGSFASGQNYLVEGILIYNGPPLPFSYYNTLSGTTDTEDIATGDLLVYGPGTPLGELIFNPTLYNETWDGEQITSFLDGTLTGAIPGNPIIIIQNGTISQ